MALLRETATSASDEIKVGSIDEWDVADESLAGDDIADQSLTGADILPRSGVDIPDVGENEFFWTDEEDHAEVSSGAVIEVGYAVADVGAFYLYAHDSPRETVCVMTPVD